MFIFVFVSLSAVSGISFSSAFSFMAENEKCFSVGLYSIHHKKVLVLNTRLGLGLPLDAMRGSLFDLTTGKISRYILLILLQNRRHIE